jgi:hypothetical protein
MKTNLLLLSLLFFFAACGDRTTTHIAIGSDGTDQFLTGPWNLTEADLFKAFGFEQSIWRGGTLAVQTLTVVRYGKPQRIELQPFDRPRIFGDQGRRRAEVNRFIADCHALLQRTKTTEGEPRSVVMVAVGDIVNDVSTSDADRRICLLFTDMKDHNAVLDLYGDGKQLWNDNPDSIRQHWTERVPLNDLTNIEVHLVHDARRDTLTPDEYETLAGIAADHLRRSNATVYIGAQYTPR